MKHELHLRERLLHFRFDSCLIKVNTPTAENLIDRVRERLLDERGFALATINLDHLVKLRHDAEFRDAYAQQDLVVADGNPIVWLSRIARRPVSLAPGADLVSDMARVASECGAPVALLGSTRNALDVAGSRLKKRVTGLEVAAKLSPTFGFDPTGSEADELIDEVRSSGAKLCFLALGAPKQEIFAAYAKTKLPGVGFVSIGAGLDFIAGTQDRAPKVIRKLALEWAWRMLSAPRRMIPRYARCFSILPSLVAEALSIRHAKPTS